MSTEEFLTEEEKYYQALTGTTVPPANSALGNGTADRSHLIEEYEEMERRNKRHKSRSRLKKTGASKMPWH